MKAWLLIGVSVSQVAAYALDFDFKRMPLRQVVEAIAGDENIIYQNPLREVVVDYKIGGVSSEEALKTLLQRQGYKITRDGNNLVIQSAPEKRGPSAAAPVVVEPPITEMIVLSAVLAKDIELNLKTFLGAGMNLSIHEAGNAVIIRGPADQVRELSDLIKKMDQAHRQVFIEAKIVETSTNFSNGLGIEWGSPISDRSLVAGANLKSPIPNSPLLAGITMGVSNRTQIEARISAGEKNGDVKIVSRPKITTLSGLAALIESTTTFNVRTLAPVSGGGSTALAGGLQQVRAGVRLKVTPIILNDSFIRLEITISKSDPDFGQQIDGIPGISDNAASTTLMVRNGDTAGIGGLVYKSRSNSRSGIPFLVNIPVLGFLFGNSQHDEIDRELLIFLTPEIMTAQKSESRQP